VAGEVHTEEEVWVVSKGKDPEKVTIKRNSTYTSSKFLYFKGYG
jgi:hypothetical protein